MKKIFIYRLVFVISIIVCFNNSIFSQEKYLRVKLQIAKEQIPVIANLGVTVDGNIDVENDYLVLEISDKEVELLKNNGYKYEVVIDDMTKYYVQRYEDELKSGIWIYGKIYDFEHFEKPF